MTTKLFTVKLGLLRLLMRVVVNLWNYLFVLVNARRCRLVGVRRRRLLLLVLVVGGGVMLFRVCWLIPMSSPVVRCWCGCWCWCVRPAALFFICVTVSQLV